MARDHHDRQEPNVIRRPAGDARIVLDCNELKPSGEQLARLQHVARAVGLEAECGPVRNTQNAALVVEGFTLPGVQHVLRNPQPVMRGNGWPRYEHDGRIRMGIDQRALDAALEHGERSFSVFMMESGIALETSRITGTPQLPVTVTKPRTR